MNGYKCVACSVVQSPGFEGFLCPACGGNLDVSYDYDEAASKIDGRFAEGSNDLFRFAALLPLKWPRSPFPLRVGGTPLYPVRPLEELKGMCNLYLKDETLNPSASLKDRASAVTVGRALDDVGHGELDLRVKHGLGEVAADGLAADHVALLVHQVGDDAGLNDLDRRGTGAVLAGHLEVELLDGAVEVRVAHLLVHVVAPRAGVVPEPHAVVLHVARVLLDDLGASEGGGGGAGGRRGG